MDKLKELLSGLSGSDPSALLPNLAELFEKLDGLLRILVLAGPACLLVMGLIYFFLSPREANHILGYRFYWGMSSVSAWRFTQKLAGIVWTVLGLAMGIVMYIRCAGFAGMTQEEMIWASLWNILWELGLTVASILVINLTVIIFFDRKGRRRGRKV